MFEDLIPDLQAPARELLSAAGAAGLQPRITSTRRSHAEQVKLYRRWVAGLSPLPAAMPGTSPHEFGYAFDLVVSPWEALQDVGYTWQTWGGIWGGARDPVHFQYPGFVVPETDFQPSAPSQTVADWFMAQYNKIPWWASLLMPAASMAQKATSEKTSYLRSLIEKFGL